MVSLSRTAKRLVMLSADALAAPLLLWLAYGLRCVTNADCVGGAHCLCPPSQPNCSNKQRICLPTEIGTGHYCESNMRNAASL